jgi:hypothetical protein
MQRQDIQNLFVDTLGDDVAPPNAATEARNFIGSTHLGVRIMALGILVKAGSTDEREAAWLKLRRIVRHHRASLGAEDRYNLVFILMQCQSDRHVAEGEFRSFVCEMAGDEGPHIRCDALVILHRFAKRGDHSAVTLLEQALQDTDADVRQNASTFLRALEGHGK